MKKILFFIESLAGGGAEKVLSDIVSNLDTEKYEVTVCTVSDEGIYQEKVEKCSKYYAFLKCADYRAGGIRKILYWLKMKLIYALPSRIVYRYFIREKYDVEVAFVEGFATKIISASNNSESKKVAWIHCDMEKHPHADRRYKSLQEHCEAYEQFDKIVCVSQTAKVSFEEKFFASEKICVQYNPVDSIDIKAKTMESIDLVANPMLQLGTVGRLEQPKGYVRLVKCLGELYRKGYQFAMWIIGEGTQRTQIEEYIVEQSLEDIVKLVGFQSNPYKYLGKCDAFVCSSYSEGFSTAATESLILGKPVFTVECSGMQELFGDEDCGEIVPNNDKSLYDMLERIVSGVIKPIDYQLAVQKRAEDFSIIKRIKEIEAILDS